MKPLSIILIFAALLSAVQCACNNQETFEITTKGGFLFANGERFHLKGFSWFGFETSDNTVQGLWAADYKFLLDFAKSNGFNAMRLPFYLDLILSNDSVPTTINYYKMNEDLKGLNSWQVMDKIVEYSAQNGILIMFDMHSFEAGSASQDGLWYNAEHPESLVLKGWDILMARYADQWNVVAFDLKNEPFASTWNTGNLKTDWDKAAARIGNHIHSSENGSKYLIFVEGNDDGPPCADGCFWGEDLLGVHSAEVNLTKKEKLVYSPHCYGPSVYNMPYFSVPEFPKNMPKIWTTHYGFVRNLTGSALVVGEWGGELGGTDGVWLDAYTSWLVEVDFTDTFFWCLNPNSGDTGGLLENDWKTPVTGKLDLCHKVNPNPTKITSPNGMVCTNNEGIALY